MFKNIIPISDLRKKFGVIEAALPYVDHFILTKKGKPFATLTATFDLKKNVIKKCAGAFKDLGLDNDKIWEAVLMKKSRQKSITL